MGRVIFPKGEQSDWLIDVLKKTKLDNAKIAKICNVSERTFRDWKREKFTISQFALLQIKKKFNIPVSVKARILPDFWYVSKGARKGALRRLELYGPPGTPEGRTKGGKISQIRRKLYPERYQNCILTKKYNIPLKSAKLAELCGIILGDGGITNGQLKITLNNETEPEYVEFVAKLINELFGESPRRYRSKSIGKAVILCLSGVGLIKYFKSIGLKKGNKVVRQVTVPDWILKNNEYKRACLRGLFDTDGCVFHHRHESHGFPCLNFGLIFTSFSKPLLEFVQIVLTEEGFSPKIKKGRVYLYRQVESERYFSIIGSSNKHHLTRLEQVLDKKNIWRSTQVAEGARLENA